MEIEDKKNFYDVSLTGNMKITFEQTSCPLENHASKVKDELPEQSQEDFPEKVEVKEELSQSSENIVGDNYTSLQSTVPKIEDVKSHVEALGVIETPRGTFRINEEEVNFQGSPRETLCHDEDYCIPLGTLERVEALDMSDEEFEELIATHPCHVRRLIQYLRAGEDSGLGKGCREYSGGSSLLPSTSDTEANVSTCMDIASVQAPTVPSAVNTQANMQVLASVAGDMRPSSSGMTAMSEQVPRQMLDEGSDMDSEFDDEFDEPAYEASARNLPEDEEIEEAVRDNIRIIEREMDEEVERMVSTTNSFDWVEDFDTFRGRREQFTGPTPGSIKDFDTPYDAFTEIWSKDIMELIVQETNRYANQTIDRMTANRMLTAKSRLHKWTDTNVDEIYRLFAIYMFMSICQFTSQHEYWRTNNFLEMFRFRNIMAYNRYVLLSKFLHFVDNLDASPNLQQLDGILLSKRILKLAPVVIHLNSKFSSLYQLSSDICIDESLTLVKCRLPSIQAIRSKATRFGIKSYELCESKSGYRYKFHIYGGKNSATADTVALSYDLGGKSTKVVLNLLKGLEHRGHHLTMDNFHNCPALSRYLKSLGFDSLGTLRVNRKNVPSDISKLPKNVAKGTIVARHCGDVSIIAWKDSKVVTTISTYHTDETYVGSRAGRALVKPTSVKDYNRTVGVVDSMDQKLSMYLMERKRGVKWYIKMFKRLLNVSVQNAFVLLTSSLERRGMPLMTHREFRYELANTLIKGHHHNLRECSEPSVALTRLNRDICHVPQNVHGNKNRKRCVVCKRKGKDRKVYSSCVTCALPMCFENCWSEWHTLTELEGKERISRKRKRNN